MKRRPFTTERCIDWFARLGILLAGGAHAYAIAAAYPAVTQGAAAHRPAAAKALPAIPIVGSVVREGGEPVPGATVMLTSWGLDFPSSVNLARYRTTTDE